MGGYGVEVAAGNVVFRIVVVVVGGDCLMKFVGLFVVMPVPLFPLAWR